MTTLPRTVLSHPALSYLVAAFLVICVTAMQQAPIALLLYLIPVAVAVYIARTATIVSSDGLTARAVLGSSTVGWDELRGLQLSDSGAVYAVDLAGNRLRLPCVRRNNLSPLIAASAGRIPDPATA